MEPLDSQHIKTLAAKFGSGTGWAELDPNDDEARLEYLTRYLQIEVAQSLGIAPEKLDMDQSLDDLNLDSLVVMEVRNRIKVHLGIEVPAVDFFEFPTTNQLATMLLARCKQAIEVELFAVEGIEDEALDLPVDVDGLSDEEVSAMLAQMMGEGDDEI